MVTVECQECPVRNFCPARQLEKEVNLVRRNVHFDKCPLHKAAQNTRAFYNAEEKLGK